MERGVKVRRLVEDFRTMGKNHEAVSETWRDPQHVAIAGTQGRPHPLAEGGRIATQVDRHVEDFSAQTTNELSLGLLDLIVETAYHVFARKRLVVLNKGTRDSQVDQDALIVALEKRSPVVFKDSGFKELHISNPGRYCLHRLASLSLVKISARDLHPG
jgi:hypothetical protein